MDDHSSSLDLRDSDSIDIHQDLQIERVTRAWGVSEADLRIAVAEVGLGAGDLREHLGVR
ncbi:MAG: DUF3606 domain-containing protein [Comamonadaceae bacterium]|nr:MAG: DUF3606 domain-containing protein [Comamonadaceae bacterium]